MTAPESCTIQTGSRLHFGLFGGQSGKGISFGGIGAMVEQPGLSLRIARSENRQFSGQQTDRLRGFTDLWFQFTSHEPNVEFQLTLESSPSSHVGLGTGTQIGLAVHTLLFNFFFGSVPSIETIARSSSRAQRSAVGTYGFLRGGFIVDRGKTDGESFPKLDLHCEFPPDWRFVLVHTSSPDGLSGLAENRFFTQSTDSLSCHQEKLIEMTSEVLVPSLLNGNFELFADTLFQFGKLSGSYFSNLQGGEFNGPRITELVQQVRQLGINGVGQTSWGPTVYILARSENEANQIVSDLSPLLRECESVIVAQPRNHGYQLFNGQNVLS